MQKLRLSQANDLLVVSEVFPAHGGRILVDARNSQTEVLLRTNAVVEFLNLTQEFRAWIGCSCSPVLAVAESSAFFCSARIFSLQDVPVGTFLRVHGGAAIQAVAVLPSLPVLSAAVALELPVAA